MRLSCCLEYLIFVILILELACAKKAFRERKTTKKVEKKQTEKPKQTTALTTIKATKEKKRNANMMRAAVLKEFGPPEKLIIEELPIPKPEPHQVLVKVKAAGINFVDTQIRSGKFTPSKLPKLPAILGKEAAGIIEEVGSGVFEYQKGDRVLCCFTGCGAYAEYVVCNDTQLVKFPETISFKEAATLYVSYFTAYRALVQTAEAKKDESVYVHGATGGFGTAAIQIAKHLGCKVTASFGSDKGRKLLLKVGADFLHTHREAGHTIYEYQRQNQTGFDVILETVAHRNLAESVFCTKPSSRVVVVGSDGTVEINPRILMEFEAKVAGVMLSKMSLIDFVECADFLKKGMADGWVKPVVDKVFKLDEIATAHQLIVDKTETLGRYVLDFE